MSGFLSMWRLMCNGAASKRHRLMALSNVAGTAYFTLMAIAGLWTGFFFVLPAIHGDSFSMFLFHNLLALFLYINVVGNYILAYRKSSALEQFYRQSKTTKAVKQQNRTVHCKRCDLTVPPRCHHCPLCDVCVLKRDHHCSFMATCIGYSNHGYFLCFCFYTFLASTYSVLHLLEYLVLRYDIMIRDVIDVMVLGPGVLLDVIAGIERSTPFMASVGLFYGCLVSGVVSGGFFIWHLYIVTHGLTTYEARKKHYTYCDIKKWKHHFLDIFGPKWYLSFFWPIPVPPHTPSFMFTWQSRKNVPKNSL